MNVAVHHCLSSGATDFVAVRLEAAVLYFLRFGHHSQERRPFLRLRWERGCCAT